MHTFDTLDLNPELLRAVKSLGFTEPTSIQMRAIPELLGGRDVLGQAQTGTGKTAAFGLPMINQLNLESEGIQGLVLVPTRELAIQVSDAIHSYGIFSKVKIMPVYGGQSYSIQLKKLKKGSHIVVGTPGRVLDLIRKKALDLSHVSILILDEADEMLNMGFIEDVEAIIEQTPKTRQTSLFSATLPQVIRKLADKHLQNPIEIKTHRRKVTVDKIEQRYFLLNEGDKFSALIRIIEFESIPSGLIFMRTRARASQFADKLAEINLSAEALHGEMKQSAREKVMGRFRRKQTRFLVATDVAARGLDVKDVSHVINFDVPLDQENYVHRIGRTGRAGKTGIAVTFVTPQENRRMRAIERYISQKIPRAKLPSISEILAKREEQFTEKIIGQLVKDDFSKEQTIAQQLVHWGYDPLDIAAAAIQMVRDSEKRLKLNEIKNAHVTSAQKRKYGNGSSNGKFSHKMKRKKKHESGMIRFSMNLGRSHNIHPNLIIGAIANGAGIPGRAIGAIDIQNDRTYLDISENYVKNVYHRMGNWKVQGQRAMLQQVESVR
jgi:ATP-dependent RNA helicase DeaD